MHFYQKPYISFALYEQFNHNCQLHSNSPHFILCTFLSCSDVHWHFADNATLLRDFSLTVSAAPWGNFHSVSYLSDASVDRRVRKQCFLFFFTFGFYWCSFPDLQWHCWILTVTTENTKRIPKSTYMRFMFSFFYL